MPAENSKKDIRKTSLQELQDFFESIGEKKFKAKQVQEWIWKKSALSFFDMTNLSIETRKILDAHYSFLPIELYKHQKSIDGTLKSAFKLYDGNIIESVLIPTESRMTACVSSQVGCSLSCKFCATGYMDRVRNLDAAEIYDQVVQVKNQAENYYQMPLSNIVFMGMGEPLLNYQNVTKAIRKIISPEGLNISYKRITLSTSGISKMIVKLADDGFRSNLALSLHAASDEKRNRIMPINETNSLPSLLEALQYFYNKTENRITFEYILFDNFNDSIADAEDLYKFVRQVPSKVNIIEYNPIGFASFRQTTEQKLSVFQNFLEQKGITVTVRRSRGKDIDAACGQLAVKIP